MYVIMALNYLPLLELCLCFCAGTGLPRFHMQDQVCTIMALSIVYLYWNLPMYYGPFNSDFGQSRDVSAAAPQETAAAQSGD